MESFLEKVRTMLGFHAKEKTKADYIPADLGKAIQRNEAASERARQALEEIKAEDTLRIIVGKM